MHGPENSVHLCKAFANASGAFEKFTKLQLQSFFNDSSGKLLDAATVSKERRLWWKTTLYLCSTTFV